MIIFSLVHLAFFAGTPVFGVQLSFILTIVGFTIDALCLIWTVLPTVFWFATVRTSFLFLSGGLTCVPKFPTFVALARSDVLFKSNSFPAQAELFSLYNPFKDLWIDFDNPVDSSFSLVVVLDGEIFFQAYLCVYKLFT
ncbi:hypothetical protein CDAR_617211 [Caerostris darwini]|uniref:Uncharacterized protein n=1 Tax=Caerostris darwini TaxID=1538125 RepID=A0AAV4NXG4_9ARAC|nr:hypothetical protein CDAR_617211 [Caerostris darwini]